MNLLSEVDSKLFAKCKSEGHCLHHIVLHHMLPPSHPSSHVMVLRPRCHDYDVPRVTYKATNYKAVVRL